MKDVKDNGGSAKDVFWELFRETGQPGYYLLYNRVKYGKNGNDTSRS